jgi:hypothetical protein
MPSLPLFEEKCGAEIMPPTAFMPVHSVEAALACHAITLWLPSNDE